ncbi:hypothetical protein NAPIS_ORF00045, partial [Vairimorpha apis BRL 01]
CIFYEVLDCSPGNEEREMGLDRRETGLVLHNKSVHVAEGGTEVFIIFGANLISLTTPSGCWHGRSGMIVRLYHPAELSCVLNWCIEPGDFVPILITELYPKGTPFLLQARP